MTFKFSKSALLASILLAVAGPAAAQSESPSAKKSNVSISSPIIFYLAKGEPDACGQGCSEWIAAEGQFDSGATHRLRGLLTRLGKRKLPIFFHSPGGLGHEAMAIGRLLRSRDMTAGVSETIPAGCAGASAQACTALKRSGQVLPSELRNISGCNSACVYALIGAMVRQVPPGARLGVHSGKLVVLAADGRIKGPLQRNPSVNEKAARSEALRRYLQEMRIDTRLQDIASAIPFEQVRYLNRDEMAGLGIDSREFHESRWTAVDIDPKQHLTMKFFVEPHGRSRKELRTNVIQIECAGPQRARIAYLRALGSDESGAKQTISLTAAGRNVAFSARVAEVKMDAVDTGVSFNLFTMTVPLEVLETAAARDSIEIIETATAGATGTTGATGVQPRVTKLSTAGLVQALAALRPRCGSKSDCEPSEAWSAGKAGSGAANCAVPFTNVH